MYAVLPSIDSGISRIAPGFRALSISVEAAQIVDTGVAPEALARACRSLAEKDVAWAEAHTSAWAEVFRAFGAKPQRTPCSSEALRKRVLRDGSLPSIDPIVDLYNAISIEYAVPVGGENMAAYVGEPRLVFAEGTESFDTMKDGAVVHDSPRKGEVVWRDDIGVTCRRWNWRQGTRTRLSSDASRMWFILESLPAMPLDALHEAGDRLVQGLHYMMPEAVIDARLIGIDLGNTP
ncbi:B3/4 domain-containing protein [Halomonas sp. TRM85114]|uniref:B3/B4 domain-containing protein n=1 Tax=Halomonas jincaotanensis TaxID=2810616 RepID=UPI001BD24557|nr:B3/4 domain-containing protein [Halomonas jincaotanensis]MBS9405365.1 B3/4 domain-containing protein [Halomonas jincaotanensis]